MPAPSSHPIRRFLSLGLILAAIAAWIVYALTPKPVGVDIGVVERGPMQVTVDEDGRTRIKDRYVVSSPLSGRLLRISLDVGDDVEASSTIVARIEPTDPTLLDPRAVAQAEARVRAAEARKEQAVTRGDKSRIALEFAESELGRVRGLFEKNAATSSDVDEKEMLLRTQEKEFRETQFAIEIANFELELEQSALLHARTNDEPSAETLCFEISSPITGRVLRVFEESATIVTPGDPLIEIGDPADLEIVVDVLSSDAVKIHPGAEATIEQWGGEHPLHATVRLVEPSAFMKVSALGVEEQRVNVVLDLREPVEKRQMLGDGFRVEARIVVWEKEDALKVPASALFRHEQEWSAFVVEDDIARLRLLRVGRFSETEAQIIEGLLASDRVVLHPSDKIEDGVSVYVR